jgi:hypothetical protein
MDQAALELALVPERDFAPALRVSRRRQSGDARRHNFRDSKKG